MRVLVCDDSALMRRALTKLIESERGFEVVDTARNGKEAVEKAKALRPDAITLDIEMPEMDGITALSQIMAQAPAPVLMCSTLTTEGSHAALTALRLGAVDFLAKDIGALTQDGSALREELLSKLRGLRESRVRRQKGATACAISSAAQAEGGAAQMPLLLRPGQFDAVLLGSSTGGPPVLETIFTGLPETFQTPIVVAQHMPLLFTKSLAERLNQLCKVRVVHGEDGMTLARGTVHIIPGGSHGRVRRVAGALRLEVGPEPKDALYKPSVDELLSSGAATLGARCLGVVVTGMGEDGLRGARDLSARGGMVIAQDRDSACIWGMPRAVTDAGLVRANLNPAEIAATLSQMRVSAAA